MLAARTQSGSHKHHKPRGLVCRSPVYFEGSWPLSRHMLHSPCPPALYTNSLGGVLTPPTPYYKLLGGEGEDPQGELQTLWGGVSNVLRCAPPPQGDLRLIRRKSAPMHSQRPTFPDHDPNIHSLWGISHRTCILGFPLLTLLSIHLERQCLAAEA